MKTRFTEEQMVTILRDTSRMITSGDQNDTRKGHFGRFGARTDEILKEKREIGRMDWEAGIRRLGRYERSESRLAGRQAAQSTSEQRE